MGRPKMDLPFAGSDFLTLISGAARQVFSEVTAVQRAGGGAVRELRTIEEDSHAERAPLFGVLAAVRDAGSRCFVLAIDYPLLDAPVLAHLRAWFENSSQPMLVPVWRGRPQLLCAGYGPELVPILERRVEEGRLDLRGLIDEVTAQIVGEDLLQRHFPGEPLMNVNTPADLLEAENHERQRLLASR